MNVKDVINPLVYALFQFFGYGIFVVGWLFISFCIMRAALDARQQHVRTVRRPRPQPIPFPARTGRVIAFPASCLSSSASGKVTPYA